MKNRELRMKNEGINLFYDGRPDAHFDPHSVFQLLDLLNTFFSSQCLYSLRTLRYQICCTRGLCSWHEIGIMSEYILHTGETMDKPWSPPKFFKVWKNYPILLVDVSTSQMLVFSSLLNVDGDPLSYMLRGSLVLQYSEIVPNVFDEIEKLWLDQFD